MYHTLQNVTGGMRMELSFLGRGSAFNTAQGNTAAFLREGSRLLLLDCGETVFSRLLACRLLDGVSEIVAAISHLHSDHCGSLGSLFHYCRYMLGIELRLVLPDCPAYAQDLRTLLRLYGAEPDGQRGFIRDGSDLGFAAFERFDMAPTRHAGEMPCFSFVMETAGGGVFYSGDTASPDTFCAFMRAHPGFERAYIDVTASGAGGVHLPLGELARVTPEPLRSRVRLMHVSDEDCIRAGEALGFSCVSVYGQP